MTVSLCTHTSPLSDNSSERESGIRRAATLRESRPRGRANRLLLGMPVLMVLAGCTSPAMQRSTMYPDRFAESQTAMLQEAGSMPAGTDPFLAAGPTFGSSSDPAAPRTPGAANPGYVAAPADTSGRVMLRGQVASSPQSTAAPRPGYVQMTAPPESAADPFAVEAATAPQNVSGETPGWRPRQSTEDMMTTQQVSDPAEWE